MAADQTLYESIQDSAQGYRGPALTFRNLTVSYPELLANIRLMSRRLWALGVRRDEVVCLCAPNIPQAVYLVYALNRIGAIAFIVHPLFPPQALEADLVRTRARLLLVIDQRYARYAATIKTCPVWALSAQDDLPLWQRPFYRLAYRKELRGLEAARLISAVRPAPEKDVAESHDARKPSFYLESGGTTGRAKIVVLNDRAVAYPGQQALWILEKERAAATGTAMIGVLPMFHGFGLAMGINAPLANRAVSALMVSYSGREICRLLRKKRLDYLICIPYMARKLLDYPAFRGRKLKALDHAFIGADKPAPDLFREFDGRMAEAGSKARLLEGYGLTETMTVITVNRLRAHRTGSVGRPLPGVSLRIVDRRGRVLRPGRNGHIEIAAPCLMLGYLNDPETTAAAIHTDSDGTKWLRTGDEGYLDRDGYLYFRDRYKNVFKIAGHNVFPADIESVAAQTPGLSACAAIGVPDGKHPWVALFVQPKPGQEAAALIAALQRRLAAELIRYAVPERIIAVAVMPRTNVGKIDRKALLATLGAQKVPTGLAKTTRSAARRRS